MHYVQIHQNAKDKYIDESWEDQNSIKDQPC